NLSHVHTQFTHYRKLFSGRPPKRTRLVPNTRPADFGTVGPEIRFQGAGVQPPGNIQQPNYGQKRTRSQEPGLAQDLGTAACVQREFHSGPLHKEVYAAFRGLGPAVFELLDSTAYASHSPLASRCDCTPDRIVVGRVKLQALRAPGVEQPLGHDALCRLS